MLDLVILKDYGETSLLPQVSYKSQLQVLKQKYPHIFLEYLSFHVSQSILEMFCIHIMNKWGP